MNERNLYMGILHKTIKHTISDKFRKQFLQKLINLWIGVCLLLLSRLIIK